MYIGHLSLKISIVAVFCRLWTVRRKTSTLLDSWLFGSVQLFSHVWLFATPWTAACQASLSITISWSLPKLMSIESVMPSNHLILCCTLLFLPSVFPSIRSVPRIRWSKYWSFSFSISPSNKYSRLISFRMDWLDLLAVKGLSIAEQVNWLSLEQVT